MSHLSNNDLEWLGHYELREKRFFESNTGTIDTMDVLLYHISNSLSPIYISSAGYDPIYNAGGVICFELYDSIIDTQICYGYTRLATNDSLHISFSGFYKGESYRHLNCKAKKIRFDKFMYNNIDYPDCIIADFINDKDSIPDDLRPLVLKQIVWAKNVGLIFYSRENGEEFHLKPILPWVK